MVHHPRKRFGQNFLRDQNTIDRILKAICAIESQHIIEIGPGEGAITQGLLESAGKVDAIEIDRDLFRQLTNKFIGHGLQIHNADALTFNFRSLVIDDHPLRIVGNLPYNISTPLLFHLLAQRDCITDMHFMLQKEVVDRMAASPGSKTYGRLSVTLQAYCSVEPLFTVGREAFEPAPKVDSSFVRLKPFGSLPVPIDNQKVFDDLVKQAFGKRRKTLRNSLKSVITEKELEALNIDPQSRPEQLAVSSFITMANRVSSDKS